MLGKASSRPDELSMGQRSRLAVARALMAGAAVLVLDEPFAHVDEIRAERYWEVIQEHRARTGASIVFATHSAKTVMGQAESVICLREGRVLYEGTVEELYCHPATREQAECLGEVNWLPPQEARLWLPQASPERISYRPEQIAVERSGNGQLVVRSCRFKGAVASTEILHEGAGKVRRFYHRPSDRSLRPGDRVLLKVLTLLAVICLLAGCDGGEDPSLAVRAVDYWAVPPDGPRIPAPRAVAVGPGGEVFVVDTAGRILVFDEGGELKRQWRVPEAEAGSPEGICVLRDGRVAVADTHYHRVVIFDRQGRVLTTLGRKGTGPGEFIYPVDIAQDSGGDLYVSEYGSNDRVQRFTEQGEFVLAFGAFGTGEDEFQRPSGIVWHEGRVLVADAFNNCVKVFSDAGEFLGILGGEGGRPSLHFPYDIAVGGDGALYVVEYGAGRVSKVGLDGRVLGRYGRTGREAGQFQTPWGLAIDSSMRVRVADTGNRRIVELELR